MIFIHIPRFPERPLVKKLIAPMLTCAIISSVFVAPVAQAQEESFEDILFSGEELDTERKELQKTIEELLKKDPQDDKESAELLTKLSSLLDRYQKFGSAYEQYSEGLSKEIDEFRTEVEAKDSQLSEYHRVIPSYEADYKELSDERDLAQKSADELATGLLEAEEKLEEAQVKNQALQTQRQEISDLIDKAQSLGTLPQDALDQIKAKFQETNHLQEGFANKLEKLTEEKERLAKDVKRLQERTNTLTSENASLRDDLGIFKALTGLFGALSAIAAVIGLGAFLKPFIERFIR
ncbi:laminin [Corynebacterium ulcerans NCTC 12077]|nr:laminin [Corynebacterium ulcerans NCTC 12077]